MSRQTVLIADDDRSICTVLSQAVRRSGFLAVTTDDANELLQWVQEGKGDLIITDVLMPKGNGLEFLPRLKEARPGLPVIVISANNTLMTAVKANELGAFEYFPKPFDLDALMGCVERTLAPVPAEILNAPPPAITDGHGMEKALVGRSAAMQEVYKTLAKLISVDLTVMLNGESGTGKELIARTLHNLGSRKDNPFVAINMAAMPRELVESELFGHEKGAFTGAVARKAGKFEQAEGGTLFLDEIGDMPPEAQTKLLRTLQEKEYVPVGGSQPRKTDVRIVSATHRDLLELVKRGDFREDLFFRLNVVPIIVPPLRQRQEDIESLAMHCLAKAQRQGLPEKHLSADAITALQAHSWPGNVRELENLLFRLAALHSD
ncbi:MAG: sigma-54-dependent Fis family transcriptional regulator, partial [Alphaproteobacteria bacterium]|nr:sigma-54-dependent Fis family transcriptional regulator [Alphaproteobacteria bacterium]